MSRYGCVPALPFTRVIQEWLSEESRTTVDLARLLKMDVENLRKIANGKREWVGFDIADKIVVTCTEGLAWLNDPELKAIYQAFDLKQLDRMKPIAAVA